MKRIPVAVLGATGVVGQRLISLLDRHPWFRLGAVTASERSVGKRYFEACRWRSPGEPPDGLADLTVLPSGPGIPCAIAFSAIADEAAGPIEESLAGAGCLVISNCKAHRMTADVPLLIPEVNLDHLAMLPLQRQHRGWTTGGIITNPNCSTTHLALGLAPIHQRFGIRRLLVTTMQAVSGAGYPGVPSLDIMDNVIPYIGGEEEKIEQETRKLLGSLTDGHFQPADMRVSAHVNRVPVLDGHTEAVSIELERKATVIDIIECLRDFPGLPESLALPSAPRHPVVYMSQDDRPQPRLDRDVEGGMATVVGRVRACPVLDIKMTLLGHNLIRGAAGAVLLNAEILHRKGLLP